MTTIHGNNVNAQNIDSLNKYISENTSNSGVTYGKEDVERLFADIEYYNEGEEGAEKLQKQIDTLEKKISSLQDEVNDLQKRIEDADLEVQNSSKDLVDIVGQISSKEIEYQKEVEEAAEKAAKKAIEEYKNSDGSTPFEDIFGAAIEKEMRGLNLNSVKWLEVLYREKQGEISTVSSTIQGFLDETHNLQSKLDCTNATINLLTRTKNNMSSTLEGAYKNVDTDGAAAIYSGAKAELANSILEQYQTRNNSDEVDTAAGTGSEASKTAAMEKYTALKGDAKYTSGDRYSAQQNPELMNLRELIAGGMIDDLQNSGMSVNEIMQFVSTNWNVGISKTADGESWRIPKGHSSDAWVKEPAFEALTALCTDGTKKATAADVNQQQMLEMKSAVEEDDILTEMYKAGFTFKEAMTVLVKTFPDAGISYDYTNQEKRNYGRVQDTETSKPLYQTMADQILQYWNVGETITKTEDTDSPSKPPEKYDPITFQQDDTTYTFITDRDGDAMFDYNSATDNELLGSQNGIQELLDYDVNGDGVIDANDIMTDENGNAIKMLNVDGSTRTMTALDALTLMSNKQTESIANDHDVDGYKYGDNYKDKGAWTNSVDFNVTYSSAADLGITSIDVSHLQQGTGKGEQIGDSTRTYDGHQEEFEDINGSSIINQFSITTDGSKLDKNITANETLNTKENLETFYQQVSNQNAKAQATNSQVIYSRLSAEDVEEAFSDTTWVNESFASVAEQLDGIEDNLEQMLEEAKKKEGEQEAPEINVTIQELEDWCEDEKDLVPDVGDVEVEGAKDDEEDEEEVDNDNDKPADPVPDADDFTPAISTEDNISITLPGDKVISPTPTVPEIDGFTPAISTGDTITITPPPADAIITPVPSEPDVVQEIKKDLEDNPNANIPVE